jgi:hypothetical protein
MYVCMTYLFRATFVCSGSCSSRQRQVEQLNDTLYTLYTGVLIGTLESTTSDTHCTGQTLGSILYTRHLDKAAVCVLGGGAYVRE